MNARQFGIIGHGFDLSSGSCGDSVLGGTFLLVFIGTSYEHQGALWGHINI